MDCVYAKPRNRRNLATQEYNAFPAHVAKRSHGSHLGDHRGGNAQIAPGLPPSAWCHPIFGKTIAQIFARWFKAHQINQDLKGKNT